MNKFIGMLSCMAALSAAASDPLFSITGTGPSDFSSTFFYTVKNNSSYTLSNNFVYYEPKGQTPLAFTLATGTGACTNPFTLGPGKTCKLYFTIDSSKLVNNSVKGGPEICYNKKHPIYCSLPALDSQLNLTLGTPSLIAGSSGTSSLSPLLLQSYDPGAPWDTASDVQPGIMGLYLSASCNESLCVAAGYNTTPITFPILSSSTDFGQTWTKTDLSAEPGQLFTAACIPAPSGTCIVSGTNTTSGNTPELLQYIYSPSPGWSAVALGGTGTLITAGCGSTYCAVGGNDANLSSYNPLLFQSSGTSWSSIPVVLPAPTPPTVDLYIGINAISCDGTRCVAIGGKTATTGSSGIRLPFMVQSLDGSSWTVNDNLGTQVGSFTPGTSGAPNALVNPGTLSCLGEYCVAGGYDATNLKSKLIQSRDNGITWSVVPEVSGVATAEIFSVSCSSSLCVCALGLTGVKPTPVLWQTKNHGKSWEKSPITLPTTILLYSVSCKDNFCFAAGTDTVSNAGIVYQTVDAGTTWSAGKFNPALPAETILYGGQAQ